MYWVLRKRNEDGVYDLMYKTKNRVLAEAWIAKQKSGEYAIEETEETNLDLDDNPIPLRPLETLLIITIFVLLPTLFAVYKPTGR